MHQKKKKKKRIDIRMHTKAGHCFCRMRGAGKMHIPLWEVVKRGWRKGKSCERAISTASAALKVTNRLQTKLGVPFPYGAFAHRAEAGQAHGAGGNERPEGIFGWRERAGSAHNCPRVRPHLCVSQHIIPACHRTLGSTNAFIWLIQRNVH